MNFLAEIINQKRRRVEMAKLSATPPALRLIAQKVREVAASHAFSAALKDETRVNVIAEFKRKSPSKGAIRPDANPVSIATAYEAGGAAAISVLTEEDYFAGSLDDLRAVRPAVSLPILRKDFVFEDYQVYESAAAGADALLLIVAALDDETLARLRRIAEDELDMDALIEVHTSEEMERALNCGARLIGVNNRNLATFEVSLETSAELASMCGSQALLVSESGIVSADDIDRLYDLGYRGFLIGETLMRAGDPGEALNRLTRPRNGVSAS